jgi:hypothetical protein
MIRRWLEHNLGKTEIEGISRRHLFRLAAEQHLVQDVELWMTFHTARNNTSHTYDGDILKNMIEIAYKFKTEAKKLYLKTNSFQVYEERG